MKCSKWSWAEDRSKGHYPRTVGGIVACKRCEYRPRPRPLGLLEGAWLCSDLDISPHCPKLLVCGTTKVHHNSLQQPKYSECERALSLETCFQAGHVAQLLERLLCMKCWAQSPNTTSNQAWWSMLPQHSRGRGRRTRICSQPGMVAPTFNPSAWEAADKKSFSLIKALEVHCSSLPTPRLLKTQQRNTASFLWSGLLAENSPEQP